jgi:uncharacterized protein (TIGR02722 family)
MNKTLTLLSAAFVAAMFVGCATKTGRIDLGNDRGPQVAGIDYRDVQEATRALVQDLVRSGRLDRPNGGTYVMTVGKVVNDTNRRDFDTDMLTSYITEELMNSGKVMVTSAMAASAGNVDEMVNAGRSVRGNAEFNQQTVAKTGQLVAPTHSVFGKVIERQIYMDGGDRQVEYWFQLKITEIASGLQWWQKQYVIGKRAAAENALAR